MLAFHLLLLLLQVLVDAFEALDELLDLSLRHLDVHRAHAGVSISTFNQLVEAGHQGRVLLGQLLVSDLHLGFLLELFVFIEVYNFIKYLHLFLMGEVDGGGHGDAECEKENQ